MGFDVGQLLQMFSGGGQAGPVDPGGDLLARLMTKINEPGVIDQLAMQMPPPPPVDPAAPAVAQAFQQQQPGTQVPTSATPPNPQTPATQQMPGITPEYAQQGTPLERPPAPVEERNMMGGRLQQSLGQLLSGSGAGDVRPQQPQAQPQRAPSGGPPISGSASPAQIQPINTAPQNRLDPQRLQLALGQLLAGGLR